MPTRTDIQPLFMWAGSKQRMLKAYEPMFFPREVTRFVDLFAGGLTMTLWVAQRFPDAELVVNDFNPELVMLYRNLAKNEAAVTRTWRSCVSKWMSLPTPEERKAYYYTLRDEYCLRYESKSEERLSGLLLFMLQVNFNGMWKAYIKCNQRYSTPPGRCLQSKKFFDANAAKIKAVSAVLRRATITAVDFGAVPLRPGDFVYADPPYRDSLVDYPGGFAEEDQVRLASLLTSHEGDFAYSNKDIGDDFYLRHFPGANIYDLTARYTAGRGASVLNVKEVLVTNYPATASD